MNISQLARVAESKFDTRVSEEARIGSACRLVQNGIRVCILRGEAGWVVDRCDEYEDAQSSISFLTSPAAAEETKALSESDKIAELEGLRDFSSYVKAIKKFECYEAA